MRVCLFTSVFPPRISGPSTQTYHLALELRQRGFDAFVITFGEDNSFESVDGIPVHRLREFGGGLSAPTKYANAYHQSMRILTETRPDVVHHVSGMNYLCLVSGRVARKLGIPSVVKYAGDLVWERTASKGYAGSYEGVFTSSLPARALAMLERYCFSLFDAVWSTSTFQTRSVYDYHRVSAEKVVTMPNFIRLDRRAATDSCAGTNGQLTILSACRFARWKRVEDVLTAFSVLDKRRVRLKIVGGENREITSRLEIMTREMGLENYVCLVGPESPTGMKEHFQSAHIFCSASRYEPFGIALVQAMAAGLPVVAVNTGGVPDVVPHGRAGYLVSAGDTAEMAARLQTLIDHDDLRIAMGQFAAEHARRFDIEENLDEVVNLYRFAIERAGRCDLRERARVEAKLESWK
ncbi:glycosyltransferase [Candidatus Poribacteria bacterium]|nr:glycosyltransferase [Candidatus Poribacteria bacterium]